MDRAGSPVIIGAIVPIGAQERAECALHLGEEQREVDGYLEIDANAGMDLPRLKARYGDRVTFYGNLDCGEMLSFGSPESVRATTIACLEAGQGGGGHRPRAEGGQIDVLVWQSRNAGGDQG